MARHWGKEIQHWASTWSSGNDASSITINLAAVLDGIPWLTGAQRMNQYNFDVYITKGCYFVYAGSRYILYETNSFIHSRSIWIYSLSDRQADDARYWTVTWRAFISMSSIPLRLFHHPVSIMHVHFTIQWTSLLKTLTVTKRNEWQPVHRQLAMK